MVFSEGDILYMVTESVKKILSEGISNIVYHFTSLENCLNILKKNEIYLTMSTNSSDAYDNKRLFYLSTQRSRSKELGYAGHMGSCVRIQIDGQKIMNNLTGKPIDYWGTNMGKQSYYKPENDSTYGRGLTRSRQTHHNFEMEDRIVSYEPSIPEFSKYITRLDVYIDPRTDRLENTKIQKYIDDINKRINNELEKAALIYTLGSERLKINTNVYNNLKDFNYMTENTINDQMKSLYDKAYEGGDNKEYNETEAYRTSQGFMGERKKINVLTELFNVLTLGEIYRSNDKDKIIATTLKKYNLAKYINIVRKELSGRWGNSYAESCNLLSNTCNAPLRKLNHEVGDDDSLNIMRFAADILKKYGVNSFTALPSKVENNY